jgi:flagellar motility protein MotE (MotC chaperone)
MCDKCVELDGKIEHYERISASISDQLTIDRLTELVEQMKAQKAALHPQAGR